MRHGRSCGSSFEPPALGLRGVAVLALSMRQMLGGDRLTIRENKHKALYIDRSALDSVLDSLYSAKNLDNPAPNP